MSTSPMHRPFLVRREPVRRTLFLVKPLARKRAFLAAHPSSVYKIAAVGAALFLVFTTC